MADSARMKGGRWRQPGMIALARSGRQSGAGNGKGGHGRLGSSFEQMLQMPVQIIHRVVEVA